MADINRTLFARDVAEALAGRSYRAAAGAMPGVSVATLSRAVNAHPLSAGNMLALCDSLRLDPFLYLDTTGPARHPRRKSVLFQPVTTPVPRETGGLGAGRGEA